MIDEKTDKKASKFVNTIIMIVNVIGGLILGRLFGFAGVGAVLGFMSMLS